MEEERGKNVLAPVLSWIYNKERRLNQLKLSTERSLQPLLWLLFSYCFTNRIKILRPTTTAELAELNQSGIGVLIVGVPFFSPHSILLLRFLPKCPSLPGVGPKCACYTGAFDKIRILTWFQGFGRSNIFCAEKNKIDITRCLKGDFTWMLLFRR